MAQLTRKTTGNRNYIVEESLFQPVEQGYAGEAIEKLARFENFYYDLSIRQNEKIQEMEKLRADRKTLGKIQTAAWQLNV